ncbi:hypothetical protein TNCT_169791 [Trichonephila clavata]|uniref:Uncharacterized protein n=1 Tax=Trichonephila clavata TaxID=2740835 RepID=A0A8X6GWS9_TRICU|nr:hypothetical protein TNCT_169791 [Trichonephila clavata]
MTLLLPRHFIFVRKAILIYSLPSCSLCHSERGSSILPVLPSSNPLLDRSRDLCIATPFELAAALEKKTRAKFRLLSWKPHGVPSQTMRIEDLPVGSAARR